MTGLFTGLLVQRQVIGFAAFRVLRRYSAVKSVAFSNSLGSGVWLVELVASGQVRRVIIIRCQPVDKQNK